MPGYEERLRHMLRRRRRKQIDQHVRERFQRHAEQSSPPKIPTITEIVNADALIRVYYKVKAEGGHAPGPDDVTFRDLGHREVCDIMRTVARELRDATYRSSRSRQVRIPKPSGGYRTLQLRSIVHRVVAAALHDALAPYWESIFLDCSWGFRRERSVWHVLAVLEYWILEKGYAIFVQDDIRMAFDNIRIEDVMDAHRRYIRDEQLLGLVETVLGDPHDPDRLGIDQGNPSSPDALNVLLHVHFDTPLTASGNFPFWFRYADNIGAACQEVLEGRSFLGQTSQLLTPLGLTLKGKDGPPTDQRQQGANITVLGTTVRLEGDRILYGISEEQWLRLEKGLQEAHGCGNPPKAAKSVISGWLACRGPVFEEPWEPILLRVLQIASRLGFREIPHREVQRWTQSARDRWRTLRDGIRRQLSATWGHGLAELPTLGAAPPTAADDAGHQDMPEAGDGSALPACPG